MGGNYGKSDYHQLMDIMVRLDIMEAEHKSDRKEIANLNADVKSLQKENSLLKTELDTVKAENSTNSSQPPSSDPPLIPIIAENRQKRRHELSQAIRGAHISKAEVGKKIQEGHIEHRVEEIETPVNRYVTRFEIPKEYRADVSYGKNIKAIGAFLYSEGVVSNDRICFFLNSLSQDTLGISTGSIYRFFRSFSEDCSKLRPILEETLLNSEVVCTDATTITTNGRQTYIRNLSTSEYVLYYGCEKRSWMH